MALGALIVLAGSFIAGSGTAQAHDRRNIDEYTFVVGWVTEPAFVNQPNSLDLRISRTADASTSPTSRQR